MNQNQVGQQPSYLGAKLKTLDLPLARAALNRHPFRAADRRPPGQPIDPVDIDRVRHGPGGRGLAYC